MNRLGLLLALLLAFLCSPQVSQGKQIDRQAPQIQPGDSLVAKEASLELMVSDTRQAEQALQPCCCLPIIIIPWGGRFLWRRWKKF